MPFNRLQPMLIASLLPLLVFTWFSRDYIGQVDFWLLWLVALPFRAVLLPVVVETGLSHGDHFRMPGEFREYLFARFFDIGIFGMNANGGVEVGMGFSQRQNTGEVLQIDPDTYRPADAILVHAPENFGKAPREIGKVEMAMGVDQHPLDQRV